MGGYHDRVPTYLPSPTVGALHLGPLAIRGYAVCILLGIVVAVWLTQRRLEVRGGKPGQTLDIATWSVPFGILGGRLYHVITSPDASARSRPSSRARLSLRTPSSPATTT